MAARSLVIIPTVDEASNIAEVLRLVRSNAPDADVLVVDGASSDGTPQIAEELATELGQIRVLRQPVRNGIGGAYRAGFEIGLEDGYDVLVEMDADLSHDPSDLPTLLSSAHDGARLAIGSRYVPGGATPFWPWHRLLLSRGGNRYVNLVLGLGVRDATAGFRAYRARTLRDIDYRTTRADGYAFQVEMAYRVARTGGGIAEHPITFRDRVRGTSKMSGRIVVEAMLLVTSWALRDRVLRPGPAHQPMTTSLERVPAFGPTVPRERVGLAYMPGLDGIRGVALVGVLLFHAGHLRGGFLSVDLFFVLSGFLITSLLLVEWDRTGRIDLGRFWSRRLRRLLPAALVVLAATAVYAAIALDPAELDRFRLDALAALANLANWRAIEAGSDYWASFGRPSPLRHMWSLSVEEQLYLLWPATTLGALWLGRRRRWGRQTLLLITLGLAAASALAMALLVHAGDTSRAYYGTDTRASAVLLGAAAAIGLSGRSWAPHDGVVRGLRTLAPVAVVVLAVAWVRADGQDVALYRWGFVLCSASAAVLVAAVATRSIPRLVQALELWPLREVGRISYGAYLWHWPVYVVLDEPVAGSRALQTVVRVAVTLALAVASSHLVEHPVRSGRLGTASWRPVALLGAVGVAVAIGAATLGAEARPTSVAEEGPRGGAAGAPSILLLGDSQAYNLSVAATEVLGERASFAHHARIGCGIGPGLAVTEDGVAVDEDLGGEPCSEANGWLYLVVADQDPDIVVLYEGAWDVLDRRIGDEDVAFGTDRWDEVVRANFAEVLPRLGESGARVLALAAPCYPPGGEGGGHTIRDDERRVRRWNELLREVAPTVDVEVLPYDELFCDRDPDDQPEREDGVHLTHDGAVEVWRWLLPQLALPDR